LEDDYFADANPDRDRGYGEGLRATRHRRSPASRDHARADDTIARGGAHAAAGQPALVRQARSGFFRRVSQAAEAPTFDD